MKTLSFVLALFLASSVSAQSVMKVKGRGGVLRGPSRRVRHESRG